MRGKNIMKKTFLLIPIVVALAACDTQGSNPKLRKTDLKILSPQEAPAVALCSFANGLTTVSNPATELIPQFLQNNYDIIVAPAKGGLTNIVKKGAKYKMAAVVTFGNFVLVSTGNDKDNTLNEGDKVLYFQPNDIPGSVFNYLYGDLQLETYSVNAVQDTVTALNTGKINIAGNEITLDYVYSAEPLITNLGKQGKIVELASTAFSEKSEGEKIMAAAVFVNDNADTAKVDEFLKYLNEDISDEVKNPKKFKQLLNAFGDEDEQLHLFGVNATTVYNCMKNYNGLGIGYLTAKDYQKEIDFFINDILKSNLTLDEKIYY